MLSEKIRMALLGRFTVDMFDSLSNVERGRLVKGYCLATSRMINDVEENATQRGRAEAYRHILTLVADPKELPDMDDVGACENACLAALSLAIPSKPKPKTKGGRS